MIRNEVAEIDFLIVFYIKGAVVLGQSFVEPGRHPGPAHAVVDEQMDVLVKDGAEGILRSLLGGKRDVVDLVAGLEISGNFSDLAVGHGLEWPVRAIAFEDHYRGR